MLNVVLNDVEIKVLIIKQIELYVYKFICTNLYSVRVTYRCVYKKRLRL